MSELNPEAKSLFRAARAAYAPSEARLTAVGIAVSALTTASAASAGALEQAGTGAAKGLGSAASPGVATSAGALGAAGFGSATVAWIGVGLVVGAIGAAGFLVRARHVDSAAKKPSLEQPLGAPVAPAPPTPVEATPAPAPSPRPAPMVTDLPQEPVAEAPPVGNAVAAPVSAPRHRANGTVNAPVTPPAPGDNTPPASTGLASGVGAPDDSLAGEVALLRDARAALDAGNAGKSLSLLNQYAAQFPKGTLAQEQLAMRVLALCAAGRTDAARAAAHRLEQVAPHSPHLAQVHASCAGTSGE